MILFHKLEEYQTPTTMKLLSATITTLSFAGYLLALAVKVSATHADNGAVEDDMALIRPSLRRAQTTIPEELAFSQPKSPTKGLILVKDGGSFEPMIDFLEGASLASVQANGMSVLESLPEFSGNEATFVPMNSDPMHMRFGQQIHGMNVEGVSIYVHVDKSGKVLGVNGEMVNGTSVPSEPTIDASLAIEAALKESRVPTDAHESCSAPTLTVVRGLDDGEAHLAWTCTVRYNILGEDGDLQPFNDKIFAKATGDSPGLIQIHPKMYGARSIETRNCLGKTEYSDCVIVSTSPDKIVLPTDLPIEKAHNHAIVVYDYYLQKHGRDSIDNKGMTLKSLVHYYNYKNRGAYWNGPNNQIVYGDGDGTNRGPGSIAADVVAHEFSVTQRSSGLIYEDESGALNEAISDIFGALVEAYMGLKNDTDIWRLFEDTYLTPGKALRYMCDPAKDEISRDYYPDRCDYGGVHWNSGIVNLAACLMVKGGTHPRGKTTVVVPATLGYDELGSIFYQANTNCLTPSSNFAVARWCTADVFGGSHKANIHLAWDAVGVPNDIPPPSPAPTLFIIDASGIGTFTNQAATSSKLHHYTMPIREGSTIYCSTMSNDGDADLYVRFGSEATPNRLSSVNACVSAKHNTSSEYCITGQAPSSGAIVYAGVHAASSYTGLTVTCKENPPPPPPTTTNKPTSSQPSTRQPTKQPTKNIMPTKNPAVPMTEMPTKEPYNLVPTKTPTKNMPTRTPVMPTTKTPTSTNVPTDKEPGKGPTKDLPKKMPTKMPKKMPTSDGPTLKASKRF